MSFQKVAEIVNNVIKTYGNSEAYYKKYIGDAGGTTPYFGTSLTKEYAASKIIIGVIQENPAAEELTPLGADRRLDLIFNVSSLELQEKNVIIPRIEETIRDVLIFRNVLYDIIKIQFHKLQEIELYRLYCIKKTDATLSDTDADYSKVIPLTAG